MASRVKRETVVMWLPRCSVRVREGVLSVAVSVGMTMREGGRREGLLICSNASPLLQPDIHTSHSSLCPVGSGSA